MCPSQWWGDKEPLLMEGEFSGAVKQHKSTPALDYCCPSPQLGLPAGSRGPHTGRGRWTQIPTLKDLTLKTRRLFLSLLFPSRLHVRAEIAAPPPSDGSRTLPAPEKLFFFFVP